MNSITPQTPNRGLRVGISSLAWLTFFAIAASGLALLLASSIDPERVQQYLDSLATRGDAHLSIDAVARLCRVMRIAGCAAIVVGIAALCVQGRMVAVLVPLAEKILLSLRTMFRSLASELRAAGGIAIGLVPLMTALALLLRLKFIDSPMRIDESATYLFYASKPVFVGLTNYAAPNNHLFHTLLAHCSTAIFGHEPWALRLPAFVAGVAMVPLTFVVAVRSYSASVGVIAVALVATSSYLVDYSTNARGYTTQTDLFLIAIFCVQELKRRPSAGAVLGIVVASALGFWTVPTMLYAFAALMAWLALSILAGDSPFNRKQGAVLLGICCALTGGLTLLFYLPVFLVKGVRAVTGNTYVQSATFGDFLHGVGPLVASTWQLWFRDLSPVMVYVLAAAGLVGVVFQSLGRMRCAADRVPLAATAVASCVACIAIQRVIPFERVWTMLMPLVYTAMAAGCILIVRWVVRDRRWDAVLAIALSLVIAVDWGHAVLITDSIVTSPEPWTLPDGPAAVTWALAHRQPNDRLIVLGNFWLPVMYYVLQAKASPDFIYYYPAPLPGRAIILQFEPRSPMQDALTILRMYDPVLSPPVLLGTFGRINLWEVHPLRPTTTAD